MGKNGNGQRRNGGGNGHDFHAEARGAANGLVHSIARDFIQQLDLAIEKEDGDQVLYIGSRGHDCASPAAIFDLLGRELRDKVKHLQYESLGRIVAAAPHQKDGGRFASLAAVLEKVDLTRSGDRILQYLAAATLAARIYDILTRPAREDRAVNERLAATPVRA